MRKPRTNFAAIAKKYIDTPELLNLKKKPVKKPKGQNNAVKPGVKDLPNRNIEKEASLEPVNSKKKTVPPKNKAKKKYFIPQVSSLEDYGVFICSEPTSVVTKLPESQEEHFAELKTEWFHNEDYSVKSSSLARLHQEISSFVKFLTPPGSEMRLWDFLFHTVEKTAAGLWVDASVQLCGSHQEGLLLSSSNININIDIPKPSGPTFALLSELEARLVRSLVISGSSRETCFGVSFTFFALFNSLRKKCLNLTEAYSGISLSITINAHIFRKSSEFIISQLEKFPAARVIILIAKYLMICRAGSKSIKQINAFHLNLLVISCFQMTLKTLNSLNPEEAYATLLLKFFSFCTSVINFKKVAISLKDGGSFFMKEKMVTSHLYICLMDDL
ncbi:Non-canonical poly(A) RNA polymerase papd5, variant 2 [Entomophthora muscae]|uniref:Non-canonical poly(A) RNA polymerase papd5, variant 2 n=1 Tax=Entomophthora muscae TaxID=34485 RepID=A0ACC2UPU5_9FUNG|nr:Non-canonical poly(A) RNA polymerase papd5, variant 2 [Entomophthora muscae]